ncbi:MAG TPA: hypothetical protein ENJ64_03790, partial [Thiotrichales bacterium]|nr:hypothetical protein [Thiotrichales bacterium]
METHHRVSVLHISSGDLWAGAEVQLFTLANALKNHTPTHVTLVLFNHGVLEQKLRNSGFAVHVLDESQLNGLQILWRLIKIIRKVQPDIVHTHRTKENILGSCAAFFSGNLPSLRTAHGAAEFKLAWHQLPKRLIHFMDYFCGRFLQKKIIAVSADLAVKLENAFPREKIDVIENGVDIDALLHDVSPAATLSSIQASTLKIGIAGRLVPVKRVDLFIEAAALLMQSRPDLDVSFHIYGDGPLRNTLENQLAALNQKQGT